MKVAIFGAGQLAMMMIQEASELNHEFVIVDPSSNPPASKYAKHLRTDYTEQRTLDYIAANYDVATIDFEHVDEASKSGRSNQSIDDIVKNTINKNA